jgi:glycosyltransferase involved in cell wall biosynthesis
MISARVVYDVYEYHAFAWSRYLPFCRRGGERIFERVENFLASRADAVLTVDSRGGSLEGRFRQCNERVRVLFNVPEKSAVPDETLKPELRAKYGDREVIAFVGGIHEDKGLSVTLRALELVSRKFPKAHLLLIGNQFHDWSAIVGNENDLADRVEVLEWMRYPALLAFLQVARVGLALYQPSWHYDRVSTGNGRKFFTYMQAGLPIVAPDFGEIGNVVREVGCGVLTDSTDPVAVAAALCDLLQDRNRAMELGDRGRRAIAAKYNWESEQDKLLDVYRILAG